MRSRRRREEKIRHLRLKAGRKHLLLAPSSGACSDYCSARETTSHPAESSLSQLSFSGGPVSWRRLTPPWILSQQKSRGVLISEGVLI